MTSPATIDLSTDRMDLQLHAGDQLRLTRLALAGRAWAEASSGLFAAVVDGRRLDALSMRLTDARTGEDRPGARHTVARLADAESGIEIDFHAVAYAGSAVLETWLTLRNTGARAVRVTRLDSIALDLPAAAYELRSFTSDWGLEFEPQCAALDGPAVVESRSGRSTKGSDAWMALGREGGLLGAAVVWSGNWVLRLAPLSSDGYRLSGGLHDADFFADLAPGQEVTAPPVVLALAEGGDTNALAAQLARAGRDHWYPRNALSDSLPVEWNHWWPYNDYLIDEATFRANVDAAARMGVEVCTLDAGWFGPPGQGAEWYERRGDWDVVNTDRFPSGIRALSDYTHAAGMKFGLWCEIEAVGRQAQLAEAHPELLATRGGERLGYVCMGSPAGQEWAFQTLSRLIEEYACDWIKLDFNLDPGAGCDRTDHGHGAGDGLLAHYQGYYRVLERVRAAYPEVVLENCSSGGLRIDLGIMRQTHMTFLSDPDWPEHSLQCFWGASELLAPERCLHWSYCDWVTEHRMQLFNAHDPALRPHQLDYYTRIGMLHAFGYSQKLCDLPAWVAERLTHHARVYKALVRRFVGAAELTRLTGQPMRFGQGERWSAWQYTMPGAEEALLFVFRLHGGEPGRTVRLRGLAPQRRYTLSWEGEARERQRTGAELMTEGIAFDDMPEEGSALIHVW